MFFRTTGGKGQRRKHYSDRQRVKISRQLPTLTFFHTSPDHQIVTQVTIQDHMSMDSDPEVKAPADDYMDWLFEKGELEENVESAYRLSDCAKELQWPDYLVKHLNQRLIRAQEALAKHKFSIGFTTMTKNMGATATRQERQSGASPYPVLKSMSRNLHSILWIQT